MRWGRRAVSQASSSAGQSAAAPLGAIGMVGGVSQRSLMLLLSAKLLLAVLLVLGSVWPHGPFEGKGMLYRLPAFLAPGLIVSWCWWKRRGDGRVYPVALDVALTLPFLFDTIGNALGFFDRYDHFDGVLHAVNWAVLSAGVTLTLSRTSAGRGAAPGFHLFAGAGFGAISIVLWEAMEFAVMHAGVAGLHLTYADTIADLLLSTAGGTVGAWWAARRLSSQAR